MSIRVKINGEERAIEEPLNISELVALLELQPKGIAVEVNREIVPKSQWEQRQLAEGDEIEMVTFVGGG